MRDFKSFSVWTKAHELALAIYRTTKNFPKDELYGLTSQMRRASSSIPTNIAEGCGRYSDTELARFCVIAAGSASELEYQLILAHDLEFINDTTFNNLTNQTCEIKRMLFSLCKKLRIE